MKPCAGSLAAFNPIDYGPTEELRAIKPLYTMIEQPKTFHDQLNTAQRVYSINYALQMARTLPALLRHADPAAATPLRSAEYGYDPDGLIQYYDRDRTVAAGTYDWEKQYTDRLSVYLDVFKGMHGLAPEAKASLETLLAEAMADHARVHLWITAFQPTADATLSKETTYPQRLAELRTYLTDVARRYRVHLSDVLDGRRYGDPRQNWYDSVHPSPPGAARLAALLQEDERGL